MDDLNVAGWQFDAAVARAEAAEAQLAEAREYLDEAIGRHETDVPLVDRIVVLVSMLAANGATTPGELDAAANSPVDALARRVDALEYTVRNLQRLAQQTHGPEAGL